MRRHPPMPYTAASRHIFFAPPPPPSSLSTASSGVLSLSLRAPTRASSLFVQNSTRNYSSCSNSSSAMQQRNFIHSRSLSTTASLSAIPTALCASARGVSGMTAAEEGAQAATAAAAAGTRISSNADSTNNSNNNNANASAGSGRSLEELIAQVDIPTLIRQRRAERRRRQQQQQQQNVVSAASDSGNNNNNTSNNSSSSTASDNSSSSSSNGGGGGDTQHASQSSAGSLDGLLSHPLMKERIIAELLRLDRALFDLKRQHELSMTRVRQQQERILADQHDRGLYYEQNSNVHTFDTVSVSLYDQRATYYHTKAVERLRNLKIFLMLAGNGGFCVYLYYRYMINPDMAYIARPLSALGSRVSQLRDTYWGALSEEEQLRLLARRARYSAPAAEAGGSR